MTNSSAEDTKPLAGIPARRVLVSAAVQAALVLVLIVLGIVLGNFLEDILG